MPKRFAFLLAAFVLSFATASTAQHTKERLAGLWYGVSLIGGDLVRVNINPKTSTLDLPDYFLYDLDAKIEQHSERILITAKGKHRIRILGAIREGVLSGSIRIDDEPKAPLQAMLNPKRVIRGRDLPDFEVVLLDTDESFKSKSLEGKFVLVDFWATWCKKCTGEIPALESAYEKFKDRMTFVSISVDDDQEKLMSFRKQHPGMAWLQANVKPDSELVSDFGIVIRGGGLPLPILVSPDGTILAAGHEELSGYRLGFMLERYVGSKQGG